MRRTSSRLLVADIGGTSTRLAVDDGVLGDVTVHRTTGLDLGEALSAHVAAHRADGLCVAVAGPVRGGRATVTNTGQRIDAADFAVPTLVVNDLHATAAGIVALRDRGGPMLGGAALAIGGGAPAPGGALAIFGIGTGLGEAFVVDGRVVPGEGGHRSFAPADPLQDALLRFLRDRQALTHDGGLGSVRSTPQVEVEWVVSGLGLGLLLEFAELRAVLGLQAREALHTRSPAEVVTTYAERDDACGLALDLFLRCAGAEAAGLALQVLATGGVYLCGGIPPRIAGAFADGRFREAFEASARMSSILKEIPVYLSTADHPALHGAVALGRAEKLC